MKTEEKGCEVKRIVLKIDDKEISVTPEQAKSLKVLLEDLFGKEVIKEVAKTIIHEYHEYPWYPKYYYVPPSLPQPNIVWCGDEGSGVINCSI